ELVGLLPTRNSTLKLIPGIGDLKANQFGDAIIGIVREYCKENNIASDDLLDHHAGPQNPKPDTKRVTLELHKMGKTIDEIAAQRGLVAGTIEGHLAHFIARGELKLLDFVSQEAVTQITQYFAASKSLSLTEA